MKKKKNGYSLWQQIKGLIFGANAMGKPEISILEEEQIQSPMKTIVKNFFSNIPSVIAVIVFLTIFSACFIMPLFYPLDLSYSDVTQQNVAPGFNMAAIPNELRNNYAMADPGATYGAGIDQDGIAYVYGQITEDKLTDYPSDMGKLVDISAGTDHILALNEEGEVFTWGFDRFSLGNIPMDVDMFSGEIIKIGTAHQVSYVLSDQGEIAFWGNTNLMDVSFSNVRGNIADVEFNTSTGVALTFDGSVEVLAKQEQAISRVPEEAKSNIVDIALSEKAVAAVTADGEVIVWGGNTNGELDLPEEMQGKVVSVEAGRNHFSALTSDGNVYSWGADNFSQASVPSSVANAEIVELTSGFHQNYAMDVDGQIYTWGLDGFLMGTDNIGRDIFTRLVAGGRMTMTVGGIAVIISAIIGITVGGFAGYYGGRVDNLLMRLSEIVGALPFLPFAMILSAVVGNSITETQRIMLIMVILGVLSWPGLARLVRAQILAEREKEFVTAAKAVGIREGSIIFKHILPNVITVIIVNITLQFASSMLTESTLSFIGFGVVEPNPTWGNMLKGAQDSQVITDFWWRWVFPAIALSLSTISINLIGEGLRQAIDPHSNER